MNELPRYIMLIRGGVSDSVIHELAEHEVAIIRNTCLEFGQCFHEKLNKPADFEWKPELLYVLATQAHSTRFCLQ